MSVVCECIDWLITVENWGSCNEGYGVLTLNTVGTVHTVRNVHTVHLVQFCIQFTNNCHLLYPTH
jgi:hypothetical protein